MYRFKKYRNKKYITNKDTNYNYIEIEQIVNSLIDIITDLDLNIQLKKTLGISPIEIYYKIEERRKRKI